MSSELEVLYNNHVYSVAVGADFPFLCIENKAVTYRKTSFGYQTDLNLIIAVSFSHLETCSCLISLIVSSFIYKMNIVLSTIYDGYMLNTIIQMLVLFLHNCYPVSFTSVSIHATCLVYSLHLIIIS